MFNRFLRKNTKQVSKSRLSQRVQLMVENLEQRLVPAAGVITLSASGTDLIITGDANGDGFSILQNNSGSYDIRTGGGTTVMSPSTKGGVPVTSGGLTFTANVATPTTDINVTGVTDITANLKGGADSILLSGDVAGGALSGGLSLLETSTAATLVVTDKATAPFNVAGQFKVSTTGTSAFDVSLVQSDTFGSVLLNGGSGGSKFTGKGGLSDADFLSATFAGGTNEVQLTGASIGSFVSYIGGSGDDRLDLVDTTVSTDVGVSFGGSAAGGEFLNIRNGTVINGNLTVNGSGHETYLIGGAKTQILGYTSLNSTGTGGTDVSVEGATLNNYLSVVTGGGSNKISINDGATINGPFGFQSAGKLDLEIGGSGFAVGTTTINGNVFQTDAGGLTSETVRIGTDKNLAVTTVNGIAVIQGWVSINAGSATGAVQVTIDGNESTTAPTIGGAFLSVVGGKGNDSIELLDGATISGTFGYDLGAGAANVAITGKGTTVTGNVFQQDPGAGVTTNTFFLTNGGEVGGFVSVNSASAAGATNVVIDGTGVSDPSKSVNTIGSYLSVVSGSGNDLVSITGATIASTVAWELGAGNDTVQTNNVLINGGFYGDFGTGNDKLLTEDAAGILAQTFLAGNTANTVMQVQAGNTTIMGSINPASAGPFGFLNMGAGNDSAELGGSATFQFVYGFTQPLVITASAGTSTLNTHLSGGISTSLNFTGGAVLQASGFTNNV